MKYVWIVVAILVVSVSSLAMVRIVPTTTLQKEKAKKVSTLPVRQLMYDGFGGKIWVEYTPTRTTRKDLKQIAAEGFTGVVVPAHSAAFVRKDAHGLHLAVSTKRHTKHCARIDAGDFWNGVIEANHRYLIGDITDVEIDSWAAVRDGVALDPHFHISRPDNGDYIKFHTSAATPTFDHYTVFLSQDAEHLMPLIDLAPSAPGFDMKNLALPSGEYGIVIKMVGRPLVRNYVSNVVMYERR